MLTATGGIIVEETLLVQERDQYFLQSPNAVWPGLQVADSSMPSTHIPRAYKAIIGFDFDDGADKAAHSVTIPSYD